MRLALSELDGANGGSSQEVCPLARERIWLSSDVGRKPAIVQSEFPRWERALLPAPPSAKLDTLNTEREISWAVAAGI
jgi:hypothetical protein